MTEARILIVDDDPALLRALPEALRLRMRDVEIETADSAQLALELIARDDYDAIVSDIKMPGMDGLALLDEVGRIRPGTPTLLITGHGEHDLTVRALRGGAYDFIQKPIERDYFFASLARAIQKRRLDREVERQRLELERHARVLAHVGDGVFLVDHDDTIQLWNPAAAAATGVAPSAAIGRRVDEVLGGWDAVRPKIPVSTAPGSDDQVAPTVPLEIRGNERWLSISGIEFAEGVVYAFRDLTAERAVDELKDIFVATVSHELRTPLAAIYGAAKTLQRDDRELAPDARDRLLSVIAHESDRLARVVSEILLASHLDSGQLDFASERVDPAELARGVIDTMQAYAADGVTLSLDVPPALPRVAADPDRLRQVLINLVDNAIKYSPEGGSVALKIEAEDGHLRFSVRDEGLGIPAHEQQRIFGKFYRVDAQMSRGVGGTGLGLYVCRELVRRMGGRIWVESEPGGGSTFFVELSLLDVGRGQHGAPATESAQTA